VKTHDELKSLIAPYVLGAVSPEELEEVRAHIISCEECMAEADDYAGVVASLESSVQPARVPEGLVDGVMSRVESERSGVAVATPAEPGPAPVTRLRPARPAYVFVAAAAVLLIVGVLARALVATTNDLNDSQDELADQRARVQRLVETQGGMRLGSPSGDTVGAMLPTDEGGIFMVHGLDDAPSDSTYQVWLIEDGQPLSAGTFDPESGIGGLQTDHSLENVDEVAVTLEPTGGSPMPTGPEILSS
jgi:anti-sigma-K factor RskA